MAPQKERRSVAVVRRAREVDAEGEVRIESVGTRWKSSDRCGRVDLAVADQDLLDRAAEHREDAEDSERTQREDR
jgi:hypothetical protein